MTQDATVAADPAAVEAEALRVAPEGQITMTHQDTEGYGYATEQAFAEVWEPKGWTRVEPPAEGAAVPATPATPAPATAAAVPVPAGDATSAASRRGTTADSSPSS